MLSRIKDIIYSKTFAKANRAISYAQVMLITCGQEQDLIKAKSMNFMETYFICNATSAKAYSNETI